MSGYATPKPNHVRSLVHVHPPGFLAQLLDPTSLLDHPLDLSLRLLPNIQLQIPRHGLDVVPVLFDELVKPGLFRDGSVPLDGDRGGRERFQCYAGQS